MRPKPVGRMNTTGLMLRSILGRLYLKKYLCSSCRSDFRLKIKEVPKDVLEPAREEKSLGTRGWPRGLGTAGREWHRPGLEPDV